MRATNVHQARKIFYDFMDDQRPWARNPDNVYAAMEDIVDAAEFAFTGDRRPTKKEFMELEGQARKLTESMKEHPEGYEGPCLCQECREDMLR